ncbi:hypothetical protein JOD27_000228 [Lentzea nigeriaca]|nr:hypothetical protein [Lentzea nigeriaca]MBM7856454.1 hypothetical protein [Lentzea nigeriaca]
MSRATASATPCSSQVACATTVPSPPPSSHQHRGSSGRTSSQRSAGVTTVSSAFSVAARADSSSIATFSATARTAGSAHACVPATSCTPQCRTVTSSRRSLCRNDAPVSTTSSTASARSGTFASVDPYECTIRASCPSSSSK